jgi:magnesium transporter
MHQQANDDMCISDAGYGGRNTCLLTNREQAQPTLGPSPSCADEWWVDVVDPDDARISELQHHLNIPRVFIIHALDIHELSRIEHEGATTLIVLRIPHFQGIAAAIPYITVPLGIILSERNIITVCKWQNNLVHEARTRFMTDSILVSPERFVLQLLLSAADQYLTYLHQINNMVDVLEERLQHSLRNREVLELLKYQKSLTHFTTALQMNEILLERLQQRYVLTQRPEDAELIADVLTEMREALTMTSISSDILSQMMDAFASIISNNLNVVMKFLAAFTIVLTFPTMVASFYGMNVALPAQQSPLAFVMALGISLGVSLLAALLFWKKDWL